jgi:O-antigen ligase
MKQSFPIIDKMLTVTLFLFAASSMFSISITQISAGLGGSLWLLRSHLSDTWKEQRWPLVVPILLFALASLVAVANAYDVSYSYKSLKKLLEFLIFFWILNCIRENNLRNSLSIVLISSATLSGLLGLYQYWADFNESYQNRIEGSLSTYMTFAGLLMLSGVIALAWAMFQKQTQRWVWIPILIITSCLLLTLTRQAWFGFLTALVFLVFFWKKKVLLLLPIIFLITYIVSPVSTQKRINDMFSGEDATFEMRTSLWKGGWEIFKDYPLTGCGFRCVDLVNSQYPDPTGYIGRFRGMHNNFIQLAVDTGVLGLTAWLGIWFCFFRLLYHKATALERNIFEHWTIFGSSAAVLAILAAGLFETNLYDSEVAMLLYFIMALPFSGSQNTSEAVVET